MNTEHESISDGQILDIGQRVDITYYPKKANSKRQESAKITIWKHADGGGASTHTVCEEISSVTFDEVIERAKYLITTKTIKESESEWGVTIPVREYDLAFGEIIEHDHYKYLMFSVEEFAKNMPKRDPNASEFSISFLGDRFHSIQMHNRYVRFHGMGGMLERQWPVRNDIVTVNGVRYNVGSSAIYGQHCTDSSPVLPYMFYKEGMFTTPYQKYGVIWLCNIID